MLNPSPMDGHLKEMDLSGVTWLMLNETEGNEITGEKEASRIAETLLARYPHMNIILTLGKEGALFRSGEKEFRQPCFPARTADTTAAGDTFTGYFIAALSFGKTQEEAMRLAACAAAVTVSREGAAVSIPVMADVEASINK